MIDKDMTQTEKKKVDLSIAQVGDTAVFEDGARLKISFIEERETVVDAMEYRVMCGNLGGYFSRNGRCNTGNPIVRIIPAAREVRPGGIIEMTEEEIKKCAMSEFINHNKKLFEVIYEPGKVKRIYVPAANNITEVKRLTIGLSAAEGYFYMAIEPRVRESEECIGVRLDKLPALIKALQFLQKEQE